MLRMLVTVQQRGGTATGRRNQTDQNHEMRLTMPNPGAAVVDHARERDVQRRRLRLLAIEIVLVPIGDPSRNG
jgi:hypothetical protein